jgi:hypothetical protein
VLRAVPLILAASIPSCALRDLDPVERAGLLDAPFSVPAENFFHSALLVPPLRRAEALPPRGAELRLRSSHARSNFEETIAGTKNDFDGLYHEVLAVEGAWGLSGARELSVEATWNGWDEHLDRFHVFDANGELIVSDEDAHDAGMATARHENLGVIRLRGLQEIAGGDEGTWSIEGALKIPSGRARDLTNAGTTDPALTLRHSRREGPWSIHSAFGLTWPLGEQNLFEDFADVELEPFIHSGAAAVRRLGDRWSAGAQLFGHTSAFGDVEFLDHPGGSLVIGARHLAGRWTIEGGGGPGLGWAGSHQWVFFLGATMRY